MPMMAYLAVDEPAAADAQRLHPPRPGHRRRRAGAGSEVPLPYADAHLADFEQQFCYDRFWADSGAAPNTRYLCSGLALIAVGDARASSTAAATAACSRSSGTSISCCS